jgi:hypothetical protein
MMTPLLLRKLLKIDFNQPQKMPGEQIKLEMALIAYSFTAIIKS